MQKQSFILRGSLRLKIDEIFKKQSPEKVLMIHHDLLELLNFSYEFKLGNLIGNDQIVLFQNDTQAIDDFKAGTLIFMLNPIITAVKTINSIVLRNQSRAITKRYVVYFVPKIDNFCMDQLHKVGLANKVEVHGFDFGLISFNPGLISLELSPYNHPVEVQNLSVEALLKLTKLAGRFGKIIGKGDKSKSILESYEKQLLEEDSIDPAQNNSMLIVMDRKIDPITPLLTGHSYEALLDHFYNINHNKIMVPASLLGGVGQNLQEYLLHNQRDPVYEQIAYLSIQDARQQIQKKSASVKARLEQRRYNIKSEEDSKEVNKIRSEFQQIQNHTQIILDILGRMNELHYYNLINIETRLINEGKTDLQELHFLTLEYSVQEILRVISLYSQVFLNANFYTRFQREILEIVVNNYSPVHVHSLYLLQKAGFLKNSKVRNKWQQLKLNFDLIPDNPTSYTQVHITYSCLSTRIIQLILNKNLTPELSALLDKDSFLRGLQKQHQIREVYLFFIGGITYGEISSLRLLQKQLKVKIHIMTTNVGSGKKMIEKIIANKEI